MRSRLDFFPVGFIFAPTMSEDVRADKWLWAVRFFKTRSLAVKQCTAGRIKRAGQALKPSASLRIGDRLEIPSPDGGHKRLVEVRGLLDQRVSAPLAQAAYIEHTSAEVLEAAKQRKEDQKEARSLRKEGDQGRLTKKQRRLWQSQIHRFEEES